jgi:hypothetical protein
MGVAYKGEVVISMNFLNIITVYIFIEYRRNEV